ncbi:MAG TPA: hypothetical protein VHC43_04110 [Mycobacteriales bacterium]|nr:hypothetical protein [Mycobacteriales bacterium]
MTTVDRARRPRRSIRQPAGGGGAGGGRSSKPLRRVLLLAVLVLVVGAVWIAVTGLLARSELEALRRDVGRLRVDLVAGNVTAVHRDLAAAQAKAAAAHSRTSGPAWWVGGHLPVARDPLQTIRAIALTGHGLSRTALPEVVAGGVALDPQKLRVGPDRIDLARLQQAGPSLARALPNVSAARREVGAVPQDPHPERRSQRATTRSASTVITATTT